ncbi:MAG TPA: hypothetical protein VJ810_10695 [Blastocatellia bacterium]|nr:hypothetical protein [Blastocatellia bacterium]
MFPLQRGMPCSRFTSPKTWRRMQPMAEDATKAAAENVTQLRPSICNLRVEDWLLLFRVAAYWPINIDGLDLAHARILHLIPLSVFLWPVGFQMSL